MDCDALFVWSLYEVTHVCWIVSGYDLPQPPFNPFCGRTITAQLTTHARARPEAWAQYAFVFILQSCLLGWAEWPAWLGGSSRDGCSAHSYNREKNNGSDAFGSAVNIRVPLEQVVGGSTKLATGSAVTNPEWDGDLHKTMRGFRLKSLLMTSPGENLQCIGSLSNEANQGFVPSGLSELLRSGSQEIYNVFASSKKVKEFHMAQTNPSGWVHTHN